MSMGPTPRRNGFTLLEIVLSLAILGAAAGLLTTSVVWGARGFLSSRSDEEVSSRARLALTRIAVDARRITNMADAQPTTMTFTNSQNENWILALAGTTLTLNGALLMEDVGPYPQGTNFLTYTRADGTAWTLGMPIAQLFGVSVRIIARRPKDPLLGNTLTFISTVNPRNTGAANYP
jgi:prepilin-type N-terminal cleavage/methylation domain-containing protein